MTESISFAVLDSLKTLGLVGGLIVFFAVVQGILSAAGLWAVFLFPLERCLVFFSLNPAWAHPLLSGIFEFSRGCALLCQALALSPCLMAMLSFVIAFGGLCVQMQVAAVLNKSGVALGPYLGVKLCHALAAALSAYLLTALPHPAAGLCLLLFYALSYGCIRLFCSKKYCPAIGEKAVFSGTIKTFSAPKT